MRPAGWNVAGLSIQGTGHRKEGQHCQDSCGWFDANNLLCVAVADGAGSATHASLGSWLAVRTSLLGVLSRHRADENLHEQNAAESVLRDVIWEASNSIEKAAAQLNTTPRDLSTTLIVAIASPSFIAAAQIGDGAVVVGDLEFNLSTLTAPASQEYVNEPVFLTSADAFTKVQFKTRLMEPSHIAVFTDGLQMLSLKFPETTPHKGFFVPIFRHLLAIDDEQANHDIEKFLESEKVAQRTEDDLTLVVANLNWR